MTKKEIINKLAAIDRAEFDLMMKDRWTRSDYELDDKLFQEKKKLKELLATME